MVTQSLAFKTTTFEPLTLSATTPEIIFIETGNPPNVDYFADEIASNGSPKFPLDDILALSPSSAVFRKYTSLKRLNCVKIMFRIQKEPAKAIKTLDFIVIVK